MEQTRNTNKARHLAIGCFGWFLIGNLFLFLVNLFNAEWFDFGIPRGHSNCDRYSILYEKKLARIWNFSCGNH